MAVNEDTREKVLENLLRMHNGIASYQDGLWFMQDWLLFTTGEGRLGWWTLKRYNRAFEKGQPPRAIIDAWIKENY